MKKHLKSLITILLAISLSFTACSLQSPDNTTSQNSRIEFASEDNAEFDDFLMDVFRDDITENTINLHYIVSHPENYGIDDYTVTLGDFSRESRSQTRSQLEELLKELSQYKTASLSQSQYLDYIILKDYLQHQLKLEEYSLYTEVLSASNGLQSELPVLLAEYDFNSKKDVDDYLELLEDMPRYFQEILEFEEDKSAAGLFMSDTLCQSVIESCESFIADPAENTLIKTFNNKISGVDGISDDEISQYIEANSNAVYNSVIPAYKSLISGLTQLMGTGSNDYGLYYFDEGSDYYSLLVNYSVGIDMDMDTLYEAIENQRARDQKACMKIYKYCPDILNMIDNYDFNFENEDQMLTQLQEKMTEQFPAISDTNYTISYVDPSLQDSLAPAFYLTAPIDNYQDNKIYINPSSAYEKLDEFTTLAHEGYPGHLYQTVMTYNYGIHPVRSLLNYGGFTEGWATYVEINSFSYSDVDSDVCSFLSHNKSYELSLYAALDIGINYYGWKTDEINSYWADFGVTDQDAIQQISNLIISDPGNYLKYYVGYLQFNKLLRDAKTNYGDDFSYVDFHRAILQIGPAPFYIIKDQLDTYYSKA